MQEKNNTTMKFIKSINELKEARQAPAKNTI